MPRPQAQLIELPPEPDEQAVQQLLARVKQLEEDAGANILRAQARQKRDYDRRRGQAEPDYVELKPGDPVWLLRSKRQHRITHKTEGPFLLVAKEGTTCTLQSQDGQRWNVNVERLALFE
jgi:hypothetical protein